MTQSPTTHISSENNRILSDLPDNHLEMAIP